MSQDNSIDDDANTNDQALQSVIEPLEHLLRLLSQTIQAVQPFAEEGEMIMQGLPKNIEDMSFDDVLTFYSRAQGSALFSSGVPGVSDMPPVSAGSATRFSDMIAAQGVPSAFSGVPEAAARYRSLNVDRVSSAQAEFVSRGLIRVFALPVDATLFSAAFEGDKDAVLANHYTRSIESFTEKTIYEQIRTGGNACPLLSEEKYREYQEGLYARIKHLCDTEVLDVKVLSSSGVDFHTAIQRSVEYSRHLLPVLSESAMDSHEEADQRYIKWALSKGYKVSLDPTIKSEDVSSIKSADVSIKAEEADDDAVVVMKPTGKAHQAKVDSDDEEDWTAL